MNADSLIAARVPQNVKTQFAALAHRRGVTESLLLRRLVEGAIMSAGESVDHEVGQSTQAPPEKISVRLRADDYRLLKDRSLVRRIRPSTYVSLLVHSHLRSMTPLPTEELAALKRSVAEVGAIGRNLNQIARALNHGEHANAPDFAYLQGVLKVLAGLRDHTKALVICNAESWESSSD